MKLSTSWRLRLLFILSAFTLAVATVRAQTAVPTVVTAIAAVSTRVGDASTTVDLAPHFTLPGVVGEIAQIDTLAGKFNIELLASDAPLTVANFKAYIDAGRYENTIIHRSVPTFVIQGGGYYSRLPIEHIPQFAAVANEFKRSNIRGTVAMAKTDGNPNSATSEWFVNLADNSANLNAQNGGFTVFARVLGTGMTVPDAIAKLPTTSDSYPLFNYTAGPATADNLLTVRSIKVIPISPTATQAGVITYSATSSAPGVATATVAASTLTITPVAQGTATITLKATDTNNNQTTTTVAVEVAGPGVEITRQPESQTLAAGGLPSFRVTATGEGSLTYQWFKDGAVIEGATASTLSLGAASAADSGDYTVAISNGNVTVTSAPATLLVATPQPGKLINLAVRSKAGSGDKTLIAGFTTTGGTRSGNLRLRALGPKLTDYGVPGVLADPFLQVFQDSTVVIANDNVTATDAASFDLSAGALDSALVASLAANAYTAQVTGVGGVEGVALIEVNDAQPDSTDATLPHLINVAARTEVGTGADILIAGFTINGNVPKRLLIRALGPRLTDFGVGGVLADPQVQVFRGSTMVASNNDVASIDASSAGLAVGSKDAALIVVLTPGAYTAQVSGVGGTAGVALIEVTEYTASPPSTGGVIPVTDGVSPSN